MFKILLAFISLFNLNNIKSRASMFLSVKASRLRQLKRKLKDDEVKFHPHYRSAYRDPRGASKVGPTLNERLAQAEKAAEEAHTPISIERALKELDLVRDEVKKTLLKTRSGLSAPV